MLNHLPQEPDAYVIEIGKGTPYYFYLDDEYNPIIENVTKTDPDPGKTAVLVDDNPMADGVIVVAETPTTPNGDNIVRIINNNNNSIVSMFFYHDQSFPWALDIEINGEHANARFSSYDWVNEQYSITFEQNSEYYTASNIILNRYILTGYTDNDELTTAQNTRIRNIYTALGIFATINQRFPGSENIIALNFLGDFFGFLTVVFGFVAVVAFTVSVILATPLVIGSITIIAPVLTTLPSAVAFGVGTAASLLASISYQIAVSFADEPEYIPSPSPQNPSVIITKNGIKIAPDTVYHVPKYDTLEFDLTFVNFGNSITNVQLLYYDPTTHEMILPTGVNAYLYEVRASDDTPFTNSDFTEHCKIRIYRNGYDGYFHDGTVDFLIYFDQLTVINDSTAGIEFHNPGQPSPEIRYDVLPIHFTADPAGATP